MAINKVDWPTASTPVYTPDIETDYNAQNEILERLAKGESITLTNWDATTTAPDVAAGSLIEANGVFYDVTTDTSIGVTGASPGTNYLTFDDTSPYAFEWVDTAPTWSDTLNGWYVSGDRALGHQCEWDGSTAFSDKYRLTNGSRDIFAPSGYSIQDNVVFDYITISSGSVLTDHYYLPAGYIQLGVISGNPAVGAEVRLVCANSAVTAYVIAGTMEAAISAGDSFGLGGLISNGKNYYVYVADATSTAEVTIQYVLFK